MGLISQLLKGISRVFQKLRKYFNVTAFVTSFVLPAGGSFSYYFYLEFKRNKALLSGNLTILSLLSKDGLSLKYYHKLPDIFEQLLL